MPIENMEEEGLEKNPNLELAQIKFLLSRKEHKSDKQLASRLLEAITTESESQFHRNGNTFLTAFVYIFQTWLRFTSSFARIWGGPSTNLFWQR
jgi:hypothetical protein